MNINNLDWDKWATKQFAFTNSEGIKPLVESWLLSNNKQFVLVFFERDFNFIKQYSDQGLEIQPGTPPQSIIIKGPLGIFLLRILNRMAEIPDLSSIDISVVASVKSKINQTAEKTVKQIQKDFPRIYNRSTIKFLKGEHETRLIFPFSQWFQKKEVIKKYFQNKTLTQMIPAIKLNDQLGKLNEEKVLATQTVQKNYKKIFREEILWELIAVCFIEEKI